MEGGWEEEWDVEHEWNEFKYELNENGKKIFAWKYRFLSFRVLCAFLSSMLAIILSFYNTHKNLTNFFHLLYDTFQGLMNKSQKLKVKHYSSNLPWYSHSVTLLVFGRANKGFYSFILLIWHGFIGQRGCHSILLQIIIPPNLIKWYFYWLNIIFIIAVRDEKVYCTEYLCHFKNIMGTFKINNIIE